MKVYLESLGCKLNQAEVEDWSRQLGALGWEPASSRSEAALYILNTCAVTATAESKSRHLLRLARRQNPAATLVAAGCYVTRYRGAMAEVDLAFDNRTKAELVSVLAAGAQAEAFPPVIPMPRTRASVKIQEGCDDGCTYCLVPRLRGYPRSYSAEQIIAQVRQRVDEGCREVVLTGTQPGSYRDGADDLVGLVRRLLGETGLERLRLPSLQPPDVSPALVELFADGRLCRHLHLPLQSGSDGVLARMRRRYASADFAAAVRRLRQAEPEIAITTDVMVGFPGETEAEFTESHRFCREMALAGLHVFPFSARPGTAAARFPEQVDVITKKGRVERMLALAQQLAQAYRTRFLGRRLPVLWEEEKDGWWSGLTDNYLRVYTTSHDDLGGRASMTQLVALGPKGLWGKLA